MKNLHYTFSRYADGKVANPPVKGTDTVCSECFSKPEQVSDYFADPDCQTTVSECDEKNAHCQLCGEREER